MSDTNRLELEIFAVDSTEPAVQRTRANFRSLEEQAARTAAEINRVYGANEAQFGRAFANQVRTIQERTALTGTSGLEKVLLQNHLAIQRAAGDQGKIDSIIAKNKQLAQSYLSLDAQLSKVDLIKLAGKNSSSITATLAALDREAAGAGLSGAERVIARREATIKRLASLGANEAQIQQARTRFQKILESADKENGGRYALRRAFLGAKDFFEGRTQGTVIEATDALFGTSNGGGLFGGGLAAGIKAIGGPVVAGTAALAVALGAVELASYKSMKALAEYGREVENIHLKTGLAVSEVEQFSFAAKAVGASPDAFERMMRGISEASNENSPTGDKARRALRSIGVDLRDAATGELKPTAEILQEIASGLDKLPPGVQRDAAALAILKRAGIEYIPVLEGLSDRIKRAKELGLGVTDADISQWDKYEEKIAEAGAKWEHFKHSIEAKLAPVVEVSLKLATPIAGAISDLVFADDFKKLLGGDESKKSGFEPAGTGPINGDYVRKSQEYKRRLAAFQSFQNSPDQQLAEAEERLRSIGKPTVENFPEYRSAFDDVERIKAAQRAIRAGSEGIISVRNERFQLQEQIAQREQEDKLKEIRDRLSRTTALVSPEDAVAMMALVDKTSDLQTQLNINKRRFRVGERGEVQDISNTSEFARARADEVVIGVSRRKAAEQQLQFEIDEINAQHLKLRTDREFKMEEQVRERRLQQEQQLFEDVQRMEEAATQRYFQDQETSLNRERDLALSQLGLVDAQTLKEKQALEEKKFQIEAAYAVRSEQLQIDKLNHDEAIALGELRKKFPDVPEDDPDYKQARELTIQRFEDQKAELAAATNDKITLDAQRAVNERNKYEIEENRKLYDSLKQDANGLFDQLFSKTKSWADFGKELFKTVILTPVKEIFSSQVAGLFTELLTGKKVTFGEVGNGQGAFGKLGSVLGRLGLGPARFGDKDHVSKLNLPNHLGDVTLINGDGTGMSNGAVPVVIMNTGQMAQAHTQGLQQFASSNPEASTSRSLNESITSKITYALTGGSAGSLASKLGGLGLGALLGAATSAAKPLTNATTATIRYATGGSESFGPATAGISNGFSVFDLPGAPAFYGGSSQAAPGWARRALDQSGLPYNTLGNTPGGGGLTSVVGRIVGGTPPFAPLPRGSGGGLSQSLFGGGFGGGSAGALFNGSDIKLNLRGTSVTTSAGIAQSLGGGIFGHAVGGLAGFANSNAGTLLGLSLALNGIRRGGIGGTLEATGGGALVGFRMGGPIGAAIGAAVGAGAALIKTFIGDDVSHTKDLVKQIYGISINTATANQIIQIAKQSYGGQISVAVRSPEVRKLLQLYAQTLAPNKQAQFVADTPHAASFVESGGKLFQQAQYDNGSAYSYQSPLSVYGGIQTTPLPTYGPNSGGTPVIQSLQLNVNGQSASDLLAGQVANVATPSFIQSQSIAGSQASIGRSSQQTLTLQPSAITR